MDNFASYPSYPDSGNSSPQSREIDCENQSWDEPPSNNSANYKVKFMCSYGGKIQPRPHDNLLAYIGGDTKILSVDRNIKFSAMIAKLSAMYGGEADVCFKYQLPGEDLDALITVTNDEDLEHMMLEYDRLYRQSAKLARLRLFLFLLNPSVAAGFGGGEPKSERQWFVDALNTVQVQNLEGSLPPAAEASASNPDFLFGLDKVKLPDSVPLPVPTIPEVVTKDVTAGSDCGSEDPHPIGESIAANQGEMQRQIQELQRLQIAGNYEQSVMQRQNDESNTRAYNTQDYYKVPEKVAPAPAPGSVPVQMQIPTAYYPERHIATAGYPVTAAAPGTDQPVFLIPASATGVYTPAPTLRPVTGPAGQPYYGMQRVVQEVYREQPVYNPVPSTAAVQQPKIGAFAEGISMVQPKTGVTEPTYVQVGYDGAGRQVYYTTQYQGVPPVATGGGALNQDGKVAVNGKPPQTSAV
ncbi:hypothetical protein SLEP1_g42031 [Rubroshorea leprosula]|uniref:PB1 domain-containing protein n=1 Tax=Rubroshorea leprosula TaxID=152421 RepID=A0AAV5L8K5_9ROSI|nr:hypothetical protein SLEP1_g42031 [Rubroshorea leprosula]